MKLLINLTIDLKYFHLLEQKEDRNALLEGVKNGTIDVITSYHQPNEKETTNVEFSLSPFGSIGTQVCFPLALTYLKEYIGSRENCTMYVYQSTNNPSM